MELYATGFNAWNQLHFNRPSSDEEEPDDLFAFTCVLKDESLSNVRPFLSHTVVSTSSGQKCAGSVPREHAALHDRFSGARAGFVEASNGAVVAFDADTGFYGEYRSARDAISKTNPTNKHTVSSSVDSLYAAYETGFVRLSETGGVWTWGDGRYPACLGRPVTKDNPAESAGLISLLMDLPTGRITKIAAGGYLLAALTSGNDMYCWGGRPGQPTVVDVFEEPSPVVVEDNDIIDVAVGESHMITLTTGRDIFVIGDNKNGQLGLGREIQEATRWTKLDFPLREGQKIVGVVAGSKNSFILVQEGQ